MKLVKKFAMGATALALAAVASATTVKVTGSTAFRAALYASIINQLGSGTVKAAYVGSSLAGANQVIFTNGTDTVQCCMAGSVGGINWIVNDTPVATSIGGNTATAWLNPSTGGGSASWGTAAIGAGPTYTITGGTAQGAPTYEAASKADFTMSDSLQDSTPYDSGSTGVALVQAQGSGLGVVQFVMAKGKLRTGADANFTAAYNRLTNVSSLAFQNLAASGIVPLSAFTGVAADNAYNVVLVGRDNDSGTRLAATFESGYGGVDTAMTQFRAFDGAADVGSGGGVTIKTLASAGSGTSGYASGGHVKNVLNAAVDATAVFAGKPFILVAYVGTGDKPSVASQVLTFNGFAQDATASVSTKIGQYTFWTYEQAYYKSSLSAPKAALVEAIAGGVMNSYATASSGVLLSDMAAARGSEGTVVNPF